MFKRMLGAVALATVALSTGAGAALADDDRDGDRSTQTVIRSRTFTIPKGQCSQLPADVEIQGLGLERALTEIESGDEEDGRVSLRGRLLWRISGTATDNLGGRYNFSYQLRFTKPAPIPGQGVVVDTFKMTGTGVANGFSTFVRAKVTFDSGFNPIAFEVLEQSGDPFRCDPL
jgi:hypothetical protein